MKDIYNGAENVVVWLGEDKGYAADAISLIQRVARIAQQELNSTNSTNSTDFKLSDIRFELKYTPRDDLPELGDKVWEAINMFYKNAWFRRIWVIKEVARENATMVIGRIEVSLLDVSLCSGWISAKGYLKSARTSLALDLSGNIFALRNGFPLSLMLRLTSGSQATDPRDRVYALLWLHSMYWNMQTSPPKPN
jgi:hypothetical protein